MMLMSEASFWGTAGFNYSWGAPPIRPTQPSPAQPSRLPFPCSVKQQLAEMIRINRNHPSIVAWGMDNEVFFTRLDTMPQVRRLLDQEVTLTNRLDPTRRAAVDGAQRRKIDHISDGATSTRRRAHRRGAVFLLASALALG